MATKRVAPDPVIVKKWTETLKPLMVELSAQRAVVAGIEARIGECIRGAFDEGVQVGDLKKATGYSSSRIFQYKFALRNQQNGE